MALRQLGAAGGLTGEGTAMNSRLIGQLEEVRRNYCRLVGIFLCGFEGPWRIFFLRDVA